MQSSASLRPVASRGCAFGSSPPLRSLRVCRPSAAAVSAPNSSRQRYDLDPDNASILVAGGGGVALSVTRKLKNMGSWVWQLQRTDIRRKEIEGMMAIVAKGDALSPADLQKVMDGIEEVDAVVCTLGGSTGDASVDSTGNINVINAAIKKGVKKFVLVTSLGCGDSKDSIPAKAYEVLKPVLMEKEKAENALMSQTQMAWVIIRPGGLSSDPATGTAVLTESMKSAGKVSREDVAALTIKALLTDRANGKVLACFDKNGAYGVLNYTEFQ